MISQMQVLLAWLTRIMPFLLAPSELVREHARTHVRYTAIDLTVDDKYLPTPFGMSST